MLFCEIYSAYYNAVASLINKAIEGELDVNNAYDIINEKAFSESFIYILDAIKNEQWQIINKDFSTPIKYKAEMPLSTLQLRFLKTITLDKRFKLFSENIAGLENLEPLYQPDDIRYFDVFLNGDDYDNQQYIEIFKIILLALKGNRHLFIEYESAKGKSHSQIYAPRRLEYSEKNDKFRLHCLYNKTHTIINLSRITSVRILEEFIPQELIKYRRQKNSVTLEINNERNALERCMLHFADYEKITKSMGNKKYQMKLTYYVDDETEVLIRVLSFGPVVRVTESQHFIKLIKDRIEKQEKLRAK